MCRDTNGFSKTFQSIATKAETGNPATEAHSYPNTYLGKEHSELRRLSLTETGAGESSKACDINDGRGSTGDCDSSMLEREIAQLVLQTVKNGEKETALEVLKQTHLDGNNIDVLDSKRDGTPLFWSCCRGYLDVATILLGIGADVNYRNAWDATALHGAAEHNEEGTVRMLIVEGADVNARTLRGDTPAHLAAYRGYTTIVRALVEAGGNTRLPNVDGNDVMQVANIQRNKETISYLKEIDSKYKGYAPRECRYENQYSNPRNPSLEQSRKRRNADLPVRDAKFRDDKSDGIGDIRRNPTIRIYCCPKSSVQKALSAPEPNYTPVFHSNITKYPSSPEVSDYCGGTYSGATYSTDGSNLLSGSWSSGSSRSWEALTDSSRGLVSELNDLGSYNTRYNQEKDDLYANKQV